MTPKDGAGRYRLNRKRGVVDRAVKLHGTPEHNDRVAKMAEDFFADLYGLPHDNSDKPRNAEFRIGVSTCDVKQSPYETGHLIQMTAAKTRCTFYVLVIGDPLDPDVPTPFRIGGWEWGSTFHRREHVQAAGSICPHCKRQIVKVESWVMGQEQIKPPISLDMQMATLGVLRVGLTNRVNGGQTAARP